jgi:hypothetical protein
MNKLKWFIVLMILFLFVGCYQKVNHCEIEKARQYCKDRGGIDYIREDFFGITCIYCLNGDVSLDYEIELHIKEQ